MAIDIPHFDLPFRYSGTAPVVAEQDSLADVVNCVTAIVLTQTGERLEVPSFGIDQPVFAQQPVDLSSILNQIAALEPRADIVMSQNPEIIDALIADIFITVSKREV